jgi:UDP-glucuronate 4-epimerase
MAILITGAAGFIGSHLAKRLLEDGQKVVLVDRFSDYYSVEMKQRRVRALIPSESIINIDLSEINNLQVLETLGIDSVIHLAAQPGVRLKYPNTSSYLADNILGFTNLLMWSLKARIKQFTYASSSSVYGNSNSFPLHEDKSSLNPFGPYPISKFINESLASTYSAGSLTNTTGLRFFSIYGPWGRPDMAYFRLLASGLSDYEFLLNGNRNIERDFTYIDDAVESIIRLHFLEVHRNLVYNIGGGNSRSMTDLIKIAQNLTDNQIKLKVGSDDPLDCIRTDASSAFLFDEVGFTPSVGLEVGLRSTYEWAKKDDVHTFLQAWVSSIKA